MALECSSALEFHYPFRKDCVRVKKHQLIRSAVATLGLILAIGVVPQAWGKQQTNVECGTAGACGGGAPACCGSGQCDYCAFNTTLNRECLVAANRTCTPGTPAVCSNFQIATCVFSGQPGQESDCVLWSCQTSGFSGTCDRSVCTSP